MHLLMIFIALILAVSLRLGVKKTTGNWTQRWQKALFFFLFPPAILLMTSIAVISMGYHGKMFGIESGKFSYCLAIIFLSITGLFLIKIAYQAAKSIQTIRRYPQEIVAGKIARILNTDFPYSAQIGFWKPELVISKGLLETLDLEHLDAVLAHEEAHYNYRDTFWFFWLDWIRSATAYLPNTEFLWQELLLLREIRADCQAATVIDSLLLAESLLILAQTVNQFSGLNTSQSFCAAFNDIMPSSRLEERINALLESPKTLPMSHFWSCSFLLVSLIPLIVIPLHC